LSNYNGKSTVPVGSEKNYSTNGVYDLAAMPVNGVSMKTRKQVNDIF
jgi:hypothetical protein